MEATTSRTIGKYITNTIVVENNGEKPKLNTIALRSLCRLIPFDFISYLGTPCRGWHDSLSGTYVVDKEKFDSKKLNLESLDQIGVMNE